MRASLTRFIPYFLGMLGLAAGVAAHIAFAEHYEPYHATALGLLWTALPFLLCAAAAYAVRHYWLAEVAVISVIALLLFSCVRYRGVTDDNDQPYFILAFMPAFQLFAVIALFAPILAATLVAHQHRTDFESKRNI